MINPLGWYEIPVSSFDVSGFSLYENTRIQIKPITVDLVRSFTSSDLSNKNVVNDLVEYLICTHVRLIKNGKVLTGEHVYKHDFLKLLIYIRDYSNFGKPIKVENRCNDKPVSVVVSPENIQHGAIDGRYLERFADGKFKLNTKVGIIEYTPQTLCSDEHVETEINRSQVFEFIKKDIGLCKQPKIICSCDICSSKEVNERSVFSLSDEFLQKIALSFAYKNTNDLATDEYMLTRHRAGITLEYINSMEYWRFKFFVEKLTSELEQEIKQRKEQEKKQGEGVNTNNIFSKMRGMFK